MDGECLNTTGLSKVQLRNAWNIGVAEEHHKKSQDVTNFKAILLNTQSNISEGVPFLSYLAKQDKKTTLVIPSQGLQKSEPNNKCCKKGFPEMQADSSAIM